jgi:hypothetical protein
VRGFQIGKKKSGKTDHDLGTVAFVVKFMTGIILELANYDVKVGFEPSGCMP